MGDMHRLNVARVEEMKRRGMRYADIVSMEPHLREAADEVFYRTAASRPPVDVTPPDEMPDDVARQVKRYRDQQGGPGATADPLGDAPVAF